MKIVEENISFKRGQDTKQEMGVGKQGMYEWLQEQGVKFTEYTSDTEEEALKRKTEILEHIFMVKDFIEKIISLTDLTYSDFRVAEPQAIYLNGVYGIMRSNSVLFHVFTKEDAIFMVDMLNKFSTNEYSGYTYYQEDSYLIALTKNLLSKIDNLAENRSIYQILGNQSTD